MPKGARYFINQLPDGTETAGHGELQEMGKGLKNALEEVILCGKRGEDLAGSTVYLGVTGVALTLYHTALAMRAAQPGGLLATSLTPHTPESLLKLATTLCEGCAHGPDAPPARRVTFLEGAAGPLALLAVLRHGQGLPGWQPALRGLLDLGAAQVPRMQPGECEVLYGRAGYLWALLWARDRLPAGSVPRDLIKGLVRDILEAGLAGSQAYNWPGLMYQWHGSLYLGAAHGLAGILYVLCHVMDVVNELDSEAAASGAAAGPGLAAGAAAVGPGAAAPGSTAAEGATAPGRYRHAMLAAVISLIQYRLPSGNLPSSVGHTDDRLVQWCHGAPGMLLLLPAAAKAFPELRNAWLQYAQQSAEVVWQRGLLTKGVGLCHGISGSSYSILALHDALACGPGPGARPDQSPAGDSAAGAAGAAGAATTSAALGVPAGTAGLATGGAGLSAAVGATGSQQQQQQQQQLAAQCLHRGQQFALYGAQHWFELYEVPDTPASLYEGLCGLVCLLADVMAQAENPQHRVSMPGYQL